MKRLINALEKAYFKPELETVCYGEYFDGENRGYTCQAVFVEIKHKEPYAMRLATLEKICKRYHMEMRHYNTYGFYGWSATVYEIIAQSDFENVKQAIKNQDIAQTAFYTALQAGKSEKEALQAIKTAVNAA